MMVANRLARRYGLVILGMILLSTLIAVVVVLRQPATFTARGRLLVTSSAPQSQAEATAVVSQVKAVATSADLIQAALDEVEVSRDPSAVASSVAVNGLGSSALVDLSYTDRDAAVAERVAKAISSAVVDQLNDARAEGLIEVLAGVDKQLSTLEDQLDQARQSVVENPTGITDRAAVTAIEQRLTLVLTERNDLAARIGGLPRAVLLSVPELPRQVNSRGLIARSAPSALVGLVIGLIVVGLVETACPSLWSVGAVARRLGVPVLGQVRVGRRRSDTLDLDGDTARRIRLAARRAGVSVLGVARVSGSASEAGAAAQIEQASQPTGSPDDLTPIRVHPLASLPANAEAERVGVVLVASDLTRLRAITEIRDLKEATGWPVLGVVGQMHGRGEKER